MACLPFSFRRSCKNEIKVNKRSMKISMLRKLQCCLQFSRSHTLSACSWKSPFHPIDFVCFHWINRFSVQKSVPPHILLPLSEEVLAVSRKMCFMERKIHRNRCECFSECVWRSAWAISLKVIASFFFRRVFRLYHLSWFFGGTRYYIVASWLHAFFLPDSTVATLRFSLSLSLFLSMHLYVPNREYFHIKSQKALHSFYKWKTIVKCYSTSLSCKFLIVFLYDCMRLMGVSSSASALPPTFRILSIFRPTRNLLH